MAPPEPPLAAVRESHRRLVEVVGRLTDENARQPSPLPGWTRGHVATHVADNARAFTRMTLAALDGREVPMYDGGQQGRDASIERGSTRSACELAGDVTTACADVEAAWALVSPDDWARPVSYRGMSPLADTAFARWRESEIHAVDLDLGVTCTSWSPEFCVHAVEFLLERVPASSGVAFAPEDDPHRWVVGDGNGTVVRGRLCDLAAWLAGRRPTGSVAADSDSGELPALGPWP